MSKKTVPFQPQLAIIFIICGVFFTTFFLEYPKYYAKKMTAESITEAYKKQGINIQKNFQQRKRRNSIIGAIVGGAVGVGLFLFLGPAGLAIAGKGYAVTGTIMTGLGGVAGSSAGANLTNIPTGLGIAYTSYIPKVVTSEIVIGVVILLFGIFLLIDCCRS